MSDKNINKFDELLKSKLDAHTVPFDSSNWDKLQKQLSKNTPKQLFKNPWFMSGAAAVLVVSISLSAYYFNASNTSVDLKETPTKIVENSIQDNAQIISENSNIVSNNIDKEQEIKAESKEKEVNSQNEEIDGNQIISSETSTGDNKIENSKEIETIASNNHVAENNKNEDETNPHETPGDLSHTVTPENIEVVSSKPKAIITSSEKETCLGNALKFNSEKQKDVVYLWSFGDENYSDEQNPSHKYAKPGEYIVKLIVKSKLDPNIIAQSEDFLVKIHELPMVSFDTENFIENAKPYVKFTNTSSKVALSFWNFKDGKISEDKNPIHFFKRKGTYNVSLTVVDDKGCKASKTQEVYIENDYNLLAPNSFTPNGDGLNDVFIPEALKIMNVDFSMSIFNQSNGLVYETKNLSTPWDGINNQTGERCLEGNYIWVVTLITENGEVEQYKGTVMILNK